ncbi:MAG: PTS cellobiose transporter subunit IIC [Firmicutes bacterium HGW-Firmicutes-7]|nr:MAG: PTS cellobiose transporter subunit IIC [Firmicutes bacterium HGW-Firmicutes-7]
MSTNFKDTIINSVMKAVNTKGVLALKEGILYTLPLTMVGSIFLLLAQLPIKALNDWFTSIFGPAWTEPLFQVYNATFAIIALVSVITIAYAYAKNSGHDGLMAGILSLVVFLITTSSSVTDAASGVTIGGVIPRAWTGGQGMVTAIIIGLIVGALYSKLLDKNLSIKMPDGVPEGVTKQFAALIPAAIIFTGAMLVYIFFNVALKTTFIEWIYMVIQYPLQNLTDSLPAIMLICAIAPFLWVFGVHGTSIVTGVMDGIFLANTMANQAIIDSGLALTLENGAKIVTKQFFDNFIIMTGTGITIGLVVAMIIAGKSAQSKALGKIAIFPAIFNINEPVTFGFPIVMNPLTFVPFVLIGPIAALITYTAIAIGFMPPFGGVMVPWTTPPIISGFIVAGWQGALVQIILLATSVLIYFPFFKKQDAIHLKNENEASGELI